MKKGILRRRGRWGVCLQREDAGEEGMTYVRICGCLCALQDAMWPVGMTVIAGGAMCGERR